ncbi:MAG: histidine kinase dimerization/phospho-acceptor domain-containing protein [Bacillota bacterium]|nr:histidine kinase dimerization/phospho-acceptor domain-containing protein [Bacillota bacterium]
MRQIGKQKIFDQLVIFHIMCMLILSAILLHHLCISTRYDRPNAAFITTCMILCLIILIGWFTGLVSDIRLRFENTLFRSRRQMEEIISFLPDATLVLNKEGKVIAWNHAMEEMTGIKAEDMMYKGDYAYAFPFYGECRPILANYLLDPQLEKRPNEEYVITKINDALIMENFAPCLHENGATLWSKATPLNDEEGNIAGAIESFKNITELKQLKLEIERIDRLNIIGQMAASITHEIRNPLTTIRGMLQLLSQKKEYEEDEEKFSLMLEELDRCNEIISEYLSLAKNEHVTLEQHNLNDIIQALGHLLSADAILTDKMIVFHLAEDIPRIMLNEKEIRQMLLNLARNGLDSMEAGKCLTIRTASEGNKVIMEVIDEGTGIQPEVLAMLNMPFMTTKKNVCSCGLKR